MNKHIHFCQLEKYQWFKDPYFQVIPFLPVENDKVCESKEIVHIYRKKVQKAGIYMYRNNK